MKESKSKSIHFLPYTTLRKERIAPIKFEMCSTYSSVPNKRDGRGGGGGAVLIIAK